MKKLIGVLVFFFMLPVLFVFNRETGLEKSCAFCRDEVLERQTFYTGNRVLGVLTHKPALNGHVLIIPKRHVERFEDLDPDEVEEIFIAVKKIDRAVQETFGNTDYLLIQKNGVMAGQSVPHVHFHYLPGGRFLAFRFLISPLYRPLSREKLRYLKDVLSESLLKLDATSSNQL